MKTYSESQLLIVLLFFLEVIRVRESEYHPRATAKAKIIPQRRRNATSDKRVLEREECDGQEKEMHEQVDKHTKEVHSKVTAVSSYAHILRKIANMTNKLEKEKAKE